MLDGLTTIRIKSVGRPAADFERPVLPSAGRLLCAKIVPTAARRNTPTRQVLGGGCDFGD